MDNFPLISIIIPAYNHEKYVELALNSVLEEDYPNKEIIIIDDGSKDNSKTIINHWIENNKNKIKILFKSRENKGVTKTLNELIDLANGEYIALLASDDLLCNNSLKKRYEYLKNNPHRMAAFADAIIIDADNNLVHESAYDNFFKIDREKLKNDKFLKREIVIASKVPGPALLVRKKIYDEIGRYDENICYEDWDFYLRAVSKNLLGFVDDIICKYRVHPNNSCRSEGVINIVKDNKKIILKNMKNLPEYRLYFIKFLIYDEFYLLYLKFKFYLLNRSNNEFFNYLLKNLLKYKNLIDKILTNMFKIKDCLKSD